MLEESGPWLTSQGVLVCTIVLTFWVCCMCVCLVLSYVCFYFFYFAFMGYVPELKVIDWITNARMSVHPWHNPCTTGQTTWPSGPYCQLQLWWDYFGWCDDSRDLWHVSVLIMNLRPSNGCCGPLLQSVTSRQFKNGCWDVCLRPGLRILAYWALNTFCGHT